MSKKWKLGVRRIFALGIAGLLMLAAGCGGGNNNAVIPILTPTTSVGSITAAAITGTVAAGTALSVPAGVTSMIFNSSSILTDSSGAPVTGTIITTITRSTSAGSLPAAAPAGTSLAVLLDIDMSKGATKVKNISTPITVIVAAPTGVASVDVYSFNGTNWVLEQAGVAVIGGNVTFNITHLSIWGCFFTTNQLTSTTTSPLPAGTVGTAYNQTLAAIGGTAPYTWTVAAGSTLPAGLALSSAGVISGTPTTAGTVITSITVTDAAAVSATKAFSITVNPAGAALSITSLSPLAAGTVGTAYNQTLAAIGGTAPYTWTVAAGSALPAGLVLSAAGVISGTPTAAGTVSANITVTDAAAGTATKALSITVSPAGVALNITTISPLAGGTVGTVYGPVALAAIGGTAPYTWTIAAGSTLPAGLALSTAGVISGTPTAAGTVIANIRVTDAAAGTATKALSITVNPAGVALSITTISPLAAGTVGTAYNQTMAAIGGTAPYTWTVAAGSSFPAGLALSTAGVISGTPTTAGTVSANITVTDAAAGTATNAFSITVNAAVVNAAALYQSQCSGCHRLGTIDTTGSAPNLSQTPNMPSHFPTPGAPGHQGITLSAAEIAALTAYFLAN